MRQCGRRQRRSKPEVRTNRNVWIRLGYAVGCFAEASKLGNVKFQDTKARGDFIVWLHSGRPPLDSAAFAPLVVAFQELQSDLLEFMKLRKSTTEYQLAYYPPNGSVYKKHRDAFPDDGSEQNQRRVRSLELRMHPQCPFR